MRCPSCFSYNFTSTGCPQCYYHTDQRREGVYLPIGTSLHNGEYIVGKVLGKPGGFGITYLAWDTRLDMKVAIKEYLPFQIAARSSDGTSVSIHTQDYRPDFEFGLDKFLEEAKTLAQFRHSNIVRVLNFFRENRTAYMVMDYLEGESLAEYLARVGRLTGPDAVAIILPLLDGLSHIHARNILHRDIKPANIYLTHEGQAILLDFGSARQSFQILSKSMTAIVTPGFAPWEQYHRKGKQGPWTDVYACAATLYFMLTGIVPPAGTERIVDDDLVAIGEVVPELDANIANAVMKGLLVNPENRQQSVSEMENNIKSVESLSQNSSRTLINFEKIDMNADESQAQKGRINTNNRAQSQRPIHKSKTPDLSALKWCAIIGVIIAAGWGLLSGVQQSDRNSSSEKKQSFKEAIVSPNEKPYSNNSTLPTTSPPSSVPNKPILPIETSKTYVNGRFGFRIDYPAAFIAQRPPTNGDGLRFLSPDGQASITVSGSNYTGNRMNEEISDHVRKLGNKLAYKASGDDWYALSWKENGTIYYQKAFIGRGSRNTLIFSYPESQKNLYDNWTGTLEKTFLPGNLSRGG